MPNDKTHKKTLFIRYVGDFEGNKAQTDGASVHLLSQRLRKCSFNWTVQSERVKKIFKAKKKKYHFASEFCSHTSRQHTWSELNHGTTVHTHNRNHSNLNSMLPLFSSLVCILHTIYLFFHLRSICLPIRRLFFFSFLSISLTPLSENCFERVICLISKTWIAHLKLCFYWIRKLIRFFSVFMKFSKQKKTTGNH